MVPNQQGIAVASKYFESGDSQRAEQLCNQFLKAGGDTPDVFFLLGRITSSTNRPGEAERHFRSALDRKPHFPEALNNLGNALAAQGKTNEAAETYGKALDQAPDYPEALNNLGNVLREMGKHEQARTCYQDALRRRPNYPEAHNNLGLTFRRLGQPKEAGASFRDALRYLPDYAEAHNNLGILHATEGHYEAAVAEFDAALRVRPDYVNALKNLGLAHLENGEAGKALAALERSLSLDPSSADAHVHAARALARLGRLEEAIRGFERALQMDPEATFIHVQMGRVLRKCGRLSESLSHLNKAAEISPSNAEVHLEVGRTSQLLGRIQQALESYDRGREVSPDDANICFERAKLLLRQGDYEQGWQDFPYRFKTPEWSGRIRETDEWDGSPLEGRTILVRYEGSYADLFRFSRYGSLIEERGGHVLWESPRQLAPILRSCEGIDEVVAMEDPLPHFDFSICLLSLPRIFQTSVTNVPKPTQSLNAPEEHRNFWTDRLADQDGFKVGMSWRSPAGDTNDSRSSVPLVYYQSLPWIKGLNVVSVQQGMAAEELHELDDAIPITDLGTQFDTSRGVLTDMAAVLPRLDLLITSDSPLAHLAGEMGVRTWVLLSPDSDWRWLENRTDCPWYPSVQLFRRGVDEDWQGVFDRLEAALVEELSLQTCDAGNDSAAAAAHNETGARLAEMGRHADAVVCYRYALRIRKGFFEAHNNLGNAYRNLGKLDLAVEQYRMALESRSDYAEAHNNLGIAFAVQGKRKEAESAFRKAIEYRTGYYHAHSNLGKLLLDDSKLEGAVKELETAVELKEDFALAWANLGDAQRRLERHDDARSAYESSLKHDDGRAEIHNSLGMELRELDKIRESIPCFQQALRIEPDYPEAYNNLGITLARLEDYDAAIDCYKNALRLRPNYADAYNNQGIALSRLARREEAEMSYRQALRIREHYPEAHNNLGIVLTELGQYEKAMSHFEEALRIRPSYPAAHSNLGIALTELGRLSMAELSYDEALRLDPKYADGHMNLSLVRLLQGDYANGWPEYEWRWKCNNARMPAFGQPLWDGQPIEGKKIVLHAEQGLGDTLQFVRYASLVKSRGAHVTVMCQKPLLKLLARTPGIDVLVPKIMEGDLPACDYHAPLLSLPRIFETTTSNVPSEVPYILPDQELCRTWNAELQGHQGIRIGINWQGNPRYRGDRQRSIPLVYFGELARIPGVRLFSLQKNIGHEQLVDVASDFSVVDLGPRLDEQHGSFMDTAAVIDCLDLIVTSDTALAHLCGALGANVWLALPFAADWRWLQDIDYSPWYPTMRIFRQPALGNWGTVFDNIVHNLREFIEHEAKQGPVSISVAPGELIDKITILEIKAKRFTDPDKKKNVEYELAELAAARERCVKASPELERLARQLAQVNENLWEIEDDIRLCEREKQFGSRFVELARSVYQKNDRRAALKKEINLLLGSRVIEEKGYQSY